MNLSHAERNILSELMASVSEKCGTTYSEVSTGSPNEISLKGPLSFSGNQRICIPGIAIDGEPKNMIGIYSSCEDFVLVNSVARTAKAHYEELEKTRTYFIICGSEKYIDGGMKTFNGIVGDVVVPCLVNNVSTMTEAAQTCGTMIGDGALARCLMLSSRPIVYWYGSGYSYVVPGKGKPSMALSQNYIAPKNTGQNILADPIWMAIKMKVVATTELELRTKVNDEAYWAGIERDILTRMIMICEENGTTYHEYKTLVTGLGRGIIEADENISLEAIIENICQRISIGSAGY
ncbi:hypothetical protein KKF61_08940 [Patescibacteria group bacterium]|nr:hypothetical protein [Patescibacteria group bacterium]